MLHNYVADAKDDLLDCFGLSENQPSEAFARNKSVGGCFSAATERYSGDELSISAITAH